MKDRVLVLGCGSSLNLLCDYNIPNEITTIGVNDCGKVIKPDYLLVVDNDFRDDRRKTIYDCNDKSILVSHISEHFPEFKSKINIELGEYGTLDNLCVGSKIDYSTTSTYMAVIFAYKYLNAKEIGMLGVDFTNNHYNNNDGAYKLDLETAKVHYGRLYSKLKENGCRLVNLSPTSLIDTVEKYDLKDFLYYE